MLDQILNHLRYLVACDTQNPPRAITAENRAISYCARVLKGAGCEVSIKDLGDGSVNLIATRGNARTLVNCHLDTVPADESWTIDPFKLVVDADRAIGLGACDIKGAASCMLAAIEESDGSVALLLTTDEEAGQSRCVRRFFGEGHRYERAVVAEPTGMRAVTEHRGLAAFEINFRGVAGHSSVMGADRRNAIHHATQWCSDALVLVSDPSLADVRLNIGMIKGGTKANVAASSASVVFGMRPPAGVDPETMMNKLMGLIQDPDLCALHTRFFAPGLTHSLGAEGILQDYCFERGEPVDFWTEAALFSQAGLSTVVIGPGNIKQAHAADEFVSLADLECGGECYKRIFSDPLETVLLIDSFAEANGVC